MLQHLKSLIIKCTPEPLLVQVKKLVKIVRNHALNQQQKKGNILTSDILLKELKEAGINEGDAILVHSSMSKIGYVDGGAATIVKVLQKAIGISGTLLMPAFPAKGRNYDYLKLNPIFNLSTTPSAMGAITEYFRLLPGVKRSKHPTDSVCAFGNDAEWFVAGHFGELTPYSANSPFRRLCERKGKILMLGTTLNGACTNLHTLEDAFPDFLYPIYSSQTFETIVIDENHSRQPMKTKVHNPVWSAKRNCDALKPLFIKRKVLIDCTIGKAASMLIDADKMLVVMMEEYKKRGVTMYTPNGGTIPDSK